MSNISLPKSKTLKSDFANDTSETHYAVKRCQGVHSLASTMPTLLLTGIVLNLGLCTKRFLVCTGVDALRQFTSCLT